MCYFRSDMHDAIAKLCNELNRCNQRGGRMLSVFDLLAAKTLDLDLADPEYVKSCRHFLMKIPPEVRTIEDTRRQVVKFLNGVK